MIDNLIRNGNFTSSEIVALTKKGKGTYFGAPALTYIEEKNMERKLGRSLTTESNARPLSWGKLLEGVIFDLLSTEYSLVSTDSIPHPTVPNWAGSPDILKADTVGDIKCPITLKSFCQLVQPLYDGLDGIEAMNQVRAEHKEGDTYYWQLVSNACITGMKFAELIVYAPYRSELQVIRSLAEGNRSVYWLWSAEDNELPYLVDGGYYRNINVIRFEVPQQDKEFLTERVIEASKLLYNPTSIEFNPSLLKKIS